MIQQSQPVVPPTPGDRTLKDFSQIIDNSLKTLFQAGHVHKIVTVLPAMREGNVGDIYLLDTEDEKAVCVKFNSGWFKVVLTAI